MQMCRVKAVFWWRTFPAAEIRVIAGVIHRSLNTDLFEIEPATPYPEDYFQTVEQAKMSVSEESNPP
jgi:hypothetical protein